MAKSTKESITTLINFRQYPTDGVLKGPPTATTRWLRHISGEPSGGTVLQYNITVLYGKVQFGVSL